MGDIINLKDYKESAVLEEEYLKFLTHVNKFVGIPTTIPELAKTFYFTLRYLEGSVNCLDMLSISQNIIPPLTDSSVTPNLSCTYAIIAPN